MTHWISLCAAALTAGLVTACGGGDGGGDAAAVSPPAQRQPGERFALETPLQAGGSQTSHYVVHGVTPEGDLVDIARPGLVDGVSVPVLESVTRNGRSSAITADPTALKQQQQAFYQQLWDAMAEHEGTRDPRVILAEIDDLDGRIVDLMDDVASSGVSLREYLTVYDLLDTMPEFADRQLAELNLREALSSTDLASTFDEQPPTCTTGLTRVVTQSGLNSHCRLPSNSAVAIRGPDDGMTPEEFSRLLKQTEPNIKGLLNANPESELAKQLVEKTLRKHIFELNRIVEIKRRNHEITAAKKIALWGALISAIPVTLEMMKLTPEELMAELNKYQMLLARAFDSFDPSTLGSTEARTGIVTSMR